MSLHWREFGDLMFPLGNPNTPLSQFKELTSNNDIMFIYYGVSGNPVDYDKVLENYSEEYRTTHDKFKKHDISEVLKPKIDQEILTAKEQRYVKMNFSSYLKLDRYDFQAKGFPQTAVSNATQFGWDSNAWKNSGIVITSYFVGFTNGSDFKILKVNDEAKARVIEQKLSDVEKISMVVYGFVQDVDPSDLHVKVKIFKISLLDKNGLELL